MSAISIEKLLTETLKSPGPHFMAGNAFVNAETNPLIAAFYAAAFIVQTGWKLRSSNERNIVHNPILKFCGENQGGLAVNAAVTLGVGLATVATGGSVLLGVAALAFGTANMGQALIYGGKLKFKKPIAKSFALAACEVGMIGGFMAVGLHVGLGFAALAAIAGVGGTLAAVRSFKPTVIHPDLAYADMLVTAGLTFVQAMASGHWLIAGSRVFAMMGISRLAVQRAKNDNRTSVFEVERHIPNIRRLALSFLAR